MNRAFGRAMRPVGKQRVEIVATASGLLTVGLSYIRRHPRSASTRGCVEGTGTPVPSPLDRRYRFNSLFTSMRKTSFGDAMMGYAKNRQKRGGGAHAEITAWGCFLAMVSSLRAAWSGCRTPCSQLSTVLGLTLRNRANSA